MLGMIAMPEQMSWLGTIFATTSTLALAFGLFKVSKFVFRELTSSLRNIPSPKSSNFIFGHIHEIWDADNAPTQEKWIGEFGKTFRYKGFFATNQLFTADTKAINHIFMDSYSFRRPGAAVYTVQKLLGNGVVLTWGDVHKRQRRILNPAFSPYQIRELTPIFFDKAIKLKNIWEQLVTQQAGVAQIDALGWLTRTTLDIIGTAGFNYKFGALEDDFEANPLHKAFKVVFAATSGLNLVRILRGFFPIARFLVRSKSDADMIQAANTMADIGVELMRQSKEDLARESEKLEKADSNSTVRRRDILSVLLRANTEPDLPPNQRLSDEEVRAQVPTFIVAGHETTSIAVTWTLFALTQHPDVQRKLREDLLTISTDTPTMDELNGLVYLDHVVREVLRLFPPVAGTLRLVEQDTIIPLGEPYKDVNGQLKHEVRMQKGQTVFISIVLINLSKKLWGEDAADFKPERWNSLPESVGEIPGVWGNMLTFLGGPRACIGFRFALTEIKALLFTLIRTFEFELAVPASDILKKTSIVQRPVLRTDPNNANQLPVLVRLASSK